MNQAKAIRWVVPLSLAFLLTLCAILYIGYAAKHTKPIKRTGPITIRTITEDEMIQSILAQAAKRQGEGVAAEAPGMWVSVANTTPISSINRTYHPQETCFIKEGERVVLQSMEGDQMLLRYTPRLPPSGSTCPDGTLFFVTTEKVARWSDAKKDQ